MPLPLHQQTFSLDHATFSNILATTENLLIIQDLDGVCMGLVNDPLTRTIDSQYVAATQALEPHFYVLTNGEHIGKRGVNRIIERTIDASPTQLQEEQRYLPGLAAGGVQWQGRDGQVSHPGVSETELAFLKTLPDRMANYLRDFFFRYPVSAELEDDLEDYVNATILDNIASPSFNLNSLYPAIAPDHDTFVALQTELRSLLEDLLTDAANQGLTDSFFIHYAPNLGRGPDGKEIVWFSQPGHAGTTDFQFMLRGAIKEAGVLALLNHYYFQRTSNYPLGPDFSARSAPHSLDELLALAQAKLDPELMPLMIGVGDTVTSKVQEGEVKRGGSDRNFLQLIQNLNGVFDKGNFTVYVDSSGGELKNRQPLQLEKTDEGDRVIQGPCDSADPLQLNLAFPGGHQQYCEVFIRAAKARQQQQS